MSELFFGDLNEWTAELRRRLADSERVRRQLAEALRIRHRTFDAECPACVALAASDALDKEKA